MQPKNATLGWGYHSSSANRADLERRAARYKEILQVSDLGQLTEELVSLQRATHENRAHPRKAYDLAHDLPSAGIEVIPSDPEVHMEIAWSEGPAAVARSWGTVGRYVTVKASSPFSFARIRFAVPTAEVAHLHIGTLIAARWDARSKAFRMMPASGYNETAGYAYAQISRPGTYALVGLPRDHWHMLTLRAISALARFDQVSGSGAGILRQRLLDLLAEHGGLETAQMPGATGPELDLLDMLDGPLGAVGSICHLRLPETWPAPRSEWHRVGPSNVAGRIKALAMHPENGDVIYAGAAGGGVWKTVNGGREWHPTMQNELSLAIGALAIAPSDPDVLYAATGEWTGKVERPETPSGMGAGVYRTSDGGRSWYLCGSIGSFLCTSLAVHPSNPDCVFVAGNNGLHHSIDGGIKWQSVALGAQYAEGRDAVSSVVFFDDNPRRIFAGVHRVGVYRSDDGGDTWHLLGAGKGMSHGEPMDAPKIAVGRRGLPSARVVAVKAGDRTYRSVDGGEHFACAGTLPDRASSMIPWCNVIAVDPARDDCLFAGGTSLYRTADAGVSWGKVAGYGTDVHEDQQAIVFDPAESSRMYLANDGGVWRSTNGGVDWEAAHHGLLAAQLYTVSLSEAPPLRYAATLHDADAQIWSLGGGQSDLNNGEGGAITFVPGSSDALWASSKWSSLARYRRGADNTWEQVEDGPDATLQGRQSFAASRHDANLVLTISYDRRSLLRRPPQGGVDWPVRLQLPDASLTSVVTAEADDLSAYAGDTKGRLWGSRDAGESWTCLWQAPTPNPVLSLAPCRWCPERLFVCLGNGFQRAVYRVELAEEVWACELSQHNPGWALRYGVTQILCTGFEGCLAALGKTDVLYSFDGGWSWSTSRNAPPRVTMMAGTVDHSGFLTLATHGLGVLRCLV